MNTLQLTKKLFDKLLYIHKQILLPRSGSIVEVSFVLLLIIHCIENTSVTYSEAEWLNAMYLFRNLLYLVLLFKIVFLSSYRPQELIVIGILFLFGGFSFLTTHSSSLLELCIVTIGVKDFPLRKLILIFLYIKSASILFTLFFNLTGILPSLIYENGNSSAYNTFGFVHRNVLGANMATLCLGWMYYRYRKLKNIDYIVWITLSLLTYLLASSRTGLIIMILIIMGIFSLKKFEAILPNKINLEQIVPLCFLALIVLSIIGTLFFNSDNAFWNIIDKIFTKRFYFSNLCFREYGISLLGQNIPFTSSLLAQQNKDTVKLILDNSYMRALLYYGLIPGALFLYTYYRLLKNTLKHSDLPLAFCLIIFAIYGLSERYMLDVFYNFPLIIVSCKTFITPQKHPGKCFTPFEFARNCFQRKGQ